MKKQVIHDHTIYNEEEDKHLPGYQVIHFQLQHLLENTGISNEIAEGSQSCCTHLFCFI